MFSQVVVSNLEALSENAFAATLQYAGAQPLVAQAETTPVHQRRSPPRRHRARRGVRSARDEEYSD